MNVVDRLVVRRGSASHAPFLPATTTPTSTAPDSDAVAAPVVDDNAKAPRPRPRSRMITAIAAITGLILFGTVVILGTVWSFFHADPDAALSPAEISQFDPSFHWTGPSLLDPATFTPPPPAPSPVPPPVFQAASDYFGHFAPGAYNGTRPVRAGDQIPRMIHQTWKNDQIPEKWAANTYGCRTMHPDYDYILWTDTDARSFIESEYPWFLPTFDAYPYNIERADAIRYFVLHRYGGIYMDLDMGCVRPMDPLLQFQVVLPQTKPVGMSNDLILSAAGHPFLEHAIQLIASWNKNYLIPYMTVMFSTGPMFISGAYGQYSRLHPPVLPSTPQDPTRGKTGVRILPQILYGKLQNPPPRLHIQPGAFYSHYYGSSWHAGDASLIKLLGNSGWLVVGFGMCLLGLWSYRSYRARHTQTVWRRACSLWPSRSSTSPSLPHHCKKAHVLGSNALTRTSSSLASWSADSSAAALVPSGTADGWSSDAGEEWSRDEVLDATDIEAFAAPTQERPSHKLNDAYTYARTSEGNQLHHPVPLLEKQQ